MCVERIFWPKLIFEMKKKWNLNFVFFFSFFSFWLFNFPRWWLCVCLLFKKFFHFFSNVIWWMYVIISLGRRWMVGNHTQQRGFVIRFIRCLRKMIVDETQTLKKKLFFLPKKKWSFRESIFSVIGFCLRVSNFFLLPKNFDGKSFQNEIKRISIS